MLAKAVYGQADKSPHFKPCVAVTHCSAGFMDLCSSPPDHRLTPPPCLLSYLTRHFTEVSRGNQTPAVPGYAGPLPGREEPEGRRPQTGQTSETHSFSNLRAFFLTQLHTRLLLYTEAKEDRRKLKELFSHGLQTVWQLIEMDNPRLYG